MPVLRGLSERGSRAERNGTGLTHLSCNLRSSTFATQGFLVGSVAVFVERATVGSEDTVVVEPAMVG